MDLMPLFCQAFVHLRSDDTATSKSRITYYPDLYLVHEKWFKVLVSSNLWSYANKVEKVLDLLSISLF